MRIGVVPVLHGSGGGIYQYSVTLLDALPDVEPRPELMLLVERRDRVRGQAWAARGYRVADLWPADMGWRLGNVRGRVLQRLRPGRATGDDRIGEIPALAARVRDLGLDLLLFPAPSLIGIQAGLPYVMPIHDLAHRLHPEFPEVGAAAEWQPRERLFTTILRSATTVLVDSAVGREDVLDCYPGLVEPERIGVLPFLPASYLSSAEEADDAALRAAMDLPERYLFFPAQFWPHKNHVRVVRAIGRLRERGLDVPVVMVGSASDPLRQRVRDLVFQTAAEADVSDLVRVSGYVEDRWMAPLYCGSRGVLLPTFFGPTNIPIVEAWSLGVPSLTSDIRGIREQCGDASVLVDPLSVESIADGIERLWTDEALRARLVEAGRAKVAAYARPEFVERLSEIVAETARRGQTAAGPAAAAASVAPSSGAHRPVVSVVIPTHNRSRTIAAAIESVRAQTVADLEILVVDDASTDDTVAVATALAQAEPRLRVIGAPLNRGAQAARNVGIHLARGEWIAFLDADDTWYPDSLERRLAEARRGPDGAFAVVHSAADAIGSDGSVAPFPIPPFSGDVYRDLLLAPAPMFQTLLVKREALGEIGFLDESVPAYQEWDTSIRLAAHHRFGYVAEPTFLYDLRTPGAISRDRRRGAAAYEFVVRKHAAEIRRVAGRRALADQLRVAARLRLAAGDRSGALRLVVRALAIYPLSVKKTLRLTGSIVRTSKGNDGR